jgi:predicted thioesterase
MTVQIRVEVKEVDRRIVKFSLSASDGVESISVGEHARAAVDVEKLRTRVAAKAAAAKGA